jgi:hypothetical protein
MVLIGFAGLAMWTIRTNHGMRPFLWQARCQTESANSIEQWDCCLLSPAYRKENRRMTRLRLTLPRKAHCLEG